MGTETKFENRTLYISYKEDIAEDRKNILNKSYDFFISRWKIDDDLLLDILISILVIHITFAFLGLILL